MDGSSCISSSCISCHARADVAGPGRHAGSKNPAPSTVKNLLALSVFETSLTDYAINLKSADGFFDANA